MGHPKFARPQYDTPAHPWKKGRIDEEHALKEQFGLKSTGGMKEIWKAKSKLRRWRQNAMKLIGRVDASEGHFAREKTDLTASLYLRGLLGDGASLDDVLQISVEHVLSRRLQSQVYYRGLAASMRQARQLVVHGHIALGDQKMTVPGYIITRDDESILTYHHTSPLLDETHPIRVEIDTIRATAEYGEDGEAPAAPAPAESEKSSDESFVAGIAEAAEAAPTAEDTVPKGGDE
ncbi:MAG TPA: 30S ribosomal protein S4 [Candidatus Poseidoniales archaeon]|nr:30S ribosomal protein S4 [Candidatus Poseidoniales archaeon]